MSVSCAVRPSFADSTSLSVCWARSPEDILKAQKLRAVAFGFCPPETPFDDIPPDCDIFDSYARHLMVTDTRTGHCVGTYRLLDPKGARKAGSFYTETEFDIVALTPFLAHTVELGRSCVHPDYRTGGVIALLWSALARTLIGENIRYLMGCASLDLANPDLDPDRIFSYLRLHGWGDPTLTVTPHRPYPCLLRPTGSERLPNLPPLLKGYLRLGARCIGNPSHDPLFRTADFPVWLPLSSMNGSYARHFFRTGPVLRP
ncbi:MAG: GNAT family N-acetyltransferase [Nitrospirae bacterium]|nr:GNAT family N-acetyltransferase [Nitrospirota bacterium]